MRPPKRALIPIVVVLALSACSDGPTHPKLPPPTISPRNAIAAGDFFTCVLTVQAAAECWGANTVGQLGRGTLDSIGGPAVVMGGRQYTQIAATMSTACAVAVDGSAWCWGANAGRFGNGDTTSSAVPVAVSGGLHFQVLGGAGSAFCGLTTAGTMYCWGANSNGQLGNGASLATRALTPVPVSGGQSFSGLTSALWATCGITSEKTAYCWGANSLQQLGIGSTTTPVTTPTAISGLSFSDLKLGSATSCGIAAGTTYCWGTNFFGSLGDDSVSSSPVDQPTPIVGGLAFTSIFPGSGNDVFTPVCALTSAGAAYCWGANRSGQLGTDATTATCSFTNTPALGCSGTPLPVGGGLSYAVLTIGAEHVCGITTTGQVACWGLNDRGQLGGGATASTSSTPVVVPGLEGPQQ